MLPGRRARMALAVVIMVTALVGTACSSSDSKGSSGRSTTSAPSSASSGSDEDSPSAIFAHGFPPKGSGGTCDGHTPGQDHVWMTFCKGTAQLTFHFNDAKKTVRTLKGGVCWINGTGLEIDWGTQPGEGFTGTPPDYFSVLTSSSPGPINSSAVLALDGKERQFPSVFGVIADDMDHSLPIAPAKVPEVKGDFSGSDFLSDLQFQATFNCNGKPGPLPTVAELIARAKAQVPTNSKS